MYNNNIFIQHSKSESDWNVSVNLNFFVLCLFVRLFFLAGFWGLKKMDEPLSKIFSNFVYFSPATTTTGCSLNLPLSICNQKINSGASARAARAAEPHSYHGKG